MEGDALMLCFRLGLIRASSERPNQKHTITFLTEGHHPRQGDKQKKNDLSCGVLPSRQSIECFYILAHLLRRCIRLLKVLPSRQQSAM